MRLNILRLFTLLCLIGVSTNVSARDRIAYSNVESSSVQGWKIGNDRQRYGYGIYRQDGRGWQQVPGSAIKIAGSRHNPWVINNVNRIFQWNGHRWSRVPGSAYDIADGWVIGTKAENGGYGIYRWNGYDWDQAPGGAVRIGGSYQRPWVINDRGQKFIWNGYDWDRARNQGGYRNSYNSNQRYDHDDRYRPRDYQRNSGRQYNKRW